MLFQLLFANTTHFALSVFTAFVFFSTGLLFLDAWQIDKRKKMPFVRSIGFFILAGVSAFHAASFNTPFVELLSRILEIFGFFLIAFSIIKEPILHKPGEDSKKKTLSGGRNLAIIALPLMLPVIASSLIPLSAAMALIIALLYFRRSMEGLDRQLKSASLAFLLLSLSEIIGISFFWSGTTHVFWSKALAEFGQLWSIQHIFELIGITILGFWTWGYIRFRLQIQLFATVVGLTLSIFVITTFFFTLLLLKNLENDALSHLKTDIRVVQYVIERQQAQALADAMAIAENPEVKKAFSEKNRNDLFNLTSHLMLSYNTNFLAVTNFAGQVIMRGEDRDSLGDNLIFNPTVKSALEGHRLATVVSLEGAIVPRIQINASVPIYEGSKVGGAISTGFWIDSAFVDGVKDVTGLDVTVFGGNKRAATTIVGPDGKTRFVGTLETNNTILATVLEKGQIYAGTANVLNKPYYTAYAPLMTFGNKPIGMLFVGKSQITLFETAKKSIDMLFLGSLILMVLSLAPAYFLSRYINENLKA